MSRMQQMVPQIHRLSNEHAEAILRNLPRWLQQEK